MLAIVALLVVGAVVIGVSALTSGAQHSARGCIDVTVPSTTGAALLHACGPTAVGMCSGGVPVAPDIVAAVRARCRAAGLAPGSG